MIADRAALLFPARRRPAALLAVVLLALCSMAAGHPKPSPVPYRWELKFYPGDLRLHVDPLENRAYWYFTYKVVNRTGQVQIWAPSFTLFTDAGEILSSGRDVPTRAVQELMDLQGNSLLEDQHSVIGDLLHGRENAKEGLVVWPAGSLNVNEISLFVAGISGETARVRHPVTDEPVVLRKTLQRDYLIRGSVDGLGSNAVEVVGDTWIMR